MDFCMLVHFECVSLPVYACSNNNATFGVIVFHLKNYFVWVVWVSLIQLLLFLFNCHLGLFHTTEIIFILLFHYSFFSSICLDGIFKSNF